MDDENDSALYAILPARVRHDKDLSPIAKLLYAEITASLNTCGTCKEDDHYFSTLLSTKTEDIQDSIFALHEKKYIDIAHYSETESSPRSRVIAIRMV